MFEAWWAAHRLEFVISGIMLVAILLLYGGAIVCDWIEKRIRRRKQ